MPFVKGDALAGILIVLINIVGGLVIGIVQRGMEPARAAATYTVLTIGEGLVAQIPALIISTAAGIIVTRVASEEESGAGQLGRDVGTQILAQPKALLIAGVLMLLLAVIPGLPTVPFLILGSLFGFVGWKLHREMRPADVDAPGAGDAAAAPAPGVKGAGKTGGPGELPGPLATAVAVEVGAELAARMGADGGRFVRELVPQLRARFFAETGLTLPAVRLRAPAPGLPPRGYVIRLSEVPLGGGRVEIADARVAGDAAGNLAVGDGPAVAAKAAGATGAGSGNGAPAQAATTGPDAPEERVARHLHEVLRKHGHELLGIQEAQVLLEGLERTHPALVREVIPKLCPLPLFADVLRRLAEEGVSLRNLREIVEALAEWAPHERDPVALTEHVRAGLRRPITHKHLRGGAALSVYLLDPMIEEAVRESIQRTATGSYLAMEPDLQRDIVGAVGRELESAAGERPPVILTNAEIRRYVRKLIELDHPAVQVLSYQELAPETKLQPAGRITVAQA